jgi:hypothetical protein
MIWYFCWSKSKMAAGWWGDGRFWNVVEWWTGFWTFPTHSHTQAFYLNLKNQKQFLPNLPQNSPEIKDQIQFGHFRTIAVASALRVSTWSLLNYSWDSRPHNAARSVRFCLLLCVCWSNAPHSFGLPEKTDNAPTLCKYVLITTVHHSSFYLVKYLLI